MQELVIAYAGSSYLLRGSICQSSHCSTQQDEDPDDDLYKQVLRAETKGELKVKLWRRYKLW